MKGKDVVGMHTSGGSCNSGYSASYLKILIHSANDLKYESSEDFLRRLMGTKKLRKEDIMPIYEHGSVQVRWQGQYHRISSESWHAVMGQDWEFGRDLYDDSQSTKEQYENSGEAISLKISGASGSLIKLDPAASCSSQEAIQSSDKVSTNFQKKLMKKLQDLSADINGRLSVLEGK